MECRGQLSVVGTLLLSRDFGIELRPSVLMDVPLPTETFETKYEGSVSSIQNLGPSQRSQIDRNFYSHIIFYCHTKCISH